MQILSKLRSLSRTYCVRAGSGDRPRKDTSLKKPGRVLRTLKKLRSFLGFSGYYRRFIKDYSRIVKSLNDLTSGYPPLRKGGKKTDKKGPYYHPKDPFGDRWTPLCEEAFQSVIEKLTTAPVLGFADTKLPYFLHTDASTKGLGAALYQNQGGQMRAIAFASRGLSYSESRYPAHKLEFLALKWAVTEKFSDYLSANLLLSLIATLLLIFLPLQDWMLLVIVGLQPFPLFHLSYSTGQAS